MDLEAVKNAVSDAISELPDKSYFAALVKKLEDNLNGTISAAIENAVRPLNNKIDLLERKIDVYDAHFAGLEKRLCRAEQLIDDAEQYSCRACLRIYGYLRIYELTADIVECGRKFDRSTFCVIHTRYVTKSFTKTYSFCLFFTLKLNLNHGYALNAQSCKFDEVLSTQRSNDGRHSQ